MGFILGGLTGEEYDRNYSDAQLLRRIVGYFRPHLGKMLFVALLIALNAAALALLPVLTSRGIDGALARGAQGVEVFNANLPVLLLMVAAAGLAWTFNFLRQAITARVVGDVVLTLREDVFDAAVERDMAFYDDYSTGRVVSRVTSDTQDFSNVVTLTLGLISEVLIVAIVFVILFSINVRLALITTAITPVILGAALAFRWIARRTSRQAKRVKAEVNANIQESITGIGVAKAFRQEAALHADFERVNAEAYRLGLKQGLVLQSIFPVLGFIAGLGTVVVLYYGGSAVLAGAVTRGEWFLFAESLALFWFPLTSIASFWSQFQDGLAASERVFALMDTEPQVVQTGAEPVPELEGRIEFRNVHFAYKPGSPVLQGFDLVIPAGQTVALVGHTGAGKSSLGKLIARGYEFEKGELLIDGLDIRSFDLVSYRRQLGVVQQTPYLFTGTIRDNIRYGREDASEEQVLAAARNVAGGDWLDSLPRTDRTLQVHTLSNESLQVDVLPAMGGRVWRMRTLPEGDDVLWRAGEEGAWQPASSGYEEYSEAGYRSPGWSEQYEVTDHGDLSIEMSAGLRNGLRLTRRVELAPDAPTLSITSTLSNPGKTARDGCLRVHPQFSVGDIGSAEVLVSRAGGRQTIELARPDDPDGEVDTWLRGDEMPRGEWWVVDRAADLAVICRFQPEEVSQMLLNWSGRQDRVNLELYSKQRSLGAGDSISLHQQWEVRKGLKQE